MTLEEAEKIIQDQQNTINALIKVIEREKEEAIVVNKSVGREKWESLKSKLERKYAGQKREAIQEDGGSDERGDNGIGDS